MNISGYEDNNFHDGSTQILGDLVIDGKLTLGGATGQSEYLDSGDYSGIILGVPTHWVSMGLKTGSQYRYEKNGNILQVHLYLRGEIKANTQFPQISVNVPSTDLFNVGHVGNAYVYSSFILPTGRQIYTTVNQAINTSGISGQTNILIFYEGNTATNNQETVDFFVHLVYKLSGPDIPATVLVSGGTGQGNVQNPMLESLDAGGYNIGNIGTLSATFVSAPNVISNPLLSDLQGDGNKINNISEIKTTGIEMRLIGGPLHLENDSGATDILVSNNFDMNGKDIKDVDVLSINNINNNATNDMLIEAVGALNLFGGSKVYIESSDNVELVCDLGSGINMNNNMTIEGQTIFLNSSTSTIDVSNGDIINGDLISTNDIKVFNINGRSGQDLNITNVDDPIVITGSKIEMRSNPPNTGKVELYTSIDMKDNNIDNVSILSKTGAMEFKATAGYIFDNYVDFVTKRFNGIKYIKAQVDFESLSTLSGIYVIVGNIVMTEPLVITGSCLISGYNNLSTLTFNISTGIENTFCISNINNSGTVELKDFVFTNQNVSTRSGMFFVNQAVNTNILRIKNVNYYNCKNNSPLRVVGFELAEIINCTFRYNYGGNSSAMLGISDAENIIIDSCEFYNNYQLGNPSVYFGNYIIYITGTCENITITSNQFTTYGAINLGGVSIDNTTSSVSQFIISGNIFDAQLGSNPLNLLDVDTTIHKGVICNENTGIVTCKASLEGLVNGNTIYTSTQSGIWVPVDLTGFVTGSVSRFIPGVSLYSFIYDATNPIKTLITVNCAADHSTGGTDTVRLGISVNGTVNVFVQADLNSGQTQSVNLTTVLNLNFNDVVQIVCQNISAGTNNQGFRAVSLNASLIEI